MLGIGKRLSIGSRGPRLLPADACACIPGKANTAEECLQPGNQGMDLRTTTLKSNSSLTEKHASVHPGEDKQTFSERNRVPAEAFLSLAKCLCSRLSHRHKGSAGSPLMRQLMAPMLPDHRGALPGVPLRLRRLESSAHAQQGNVWHARRPAA